MTASGAAGSSSLNLVACHLFLLISWFRVTKVFSTSHGGKYSLQQLKTYLLIVCPLGSKDGTSFPVVPETVLGFCMEWLSRLPHVILDVDEVGVR